MKIINRRQTNTVEIFDILTGLSDYRYTKEQTDLISKFEILLAEIINFSHVDERMSVKEIEIMETRYYDVEVLSHSLTNAQDAGRQEEKRINRILVNLEAVMFGWNELNKYETIHLLSQVRITDKNHIRFLLDKRVGDALVGRQRLIPYLSYEKIFPFKSDYTLKILEMVTQNGCWKGNIEDLKTNLGLEKKYAGSGAKGNLKRRVLDPVMNDINSAGNGDFSIEYINQRGGEEFEIIMNTPPEFL